MTALEPVQPPFTPGLAQCNCCRRARWIDRENKHCGMPLPNGLDCYGWYVRAS